MLFGRNKEHKNRRVVDIHSHILPGVDDGAESIEDSMRMLEIASNNGITDIICTPHFKEYLNTINKQEILRVFKQLDIQKTIYGIDINLYLGNEVLYTNGVIDKADDYYNLNNSNYMLVEFDPRTSYIKIINDLKNLKRLGLFVVLAHIERYVTIAENIKYVKEIKDMNILIQVNANSVINKNDKETYKFVNKILKKKYVDFIASDAHSSYIRTPAIKETIKYLYKKYDEEYVDGILYKNAIKYLGV